MTPFEFIFSAMSAAASIIGLVIVQDTHWRFALSLVLTGMVFFAAFHFGMAAR